MALERLPDSLIAIGASAVGLELAQMFARLGVKVTVLEGLPRVVPAEDSDVGNALGDYLREEGLEVLAGVQIEQVGRAGSGYTVSFKDRGKARAARAEQLLVATGRRANTKGSGSRRSVSRSGRRARSSSTSSSRQRTPTSTPPAT